MTGRAKWDPMRDDFNNSTYDEELNERGKLDHCRLYITNIPKGLNEDGLKAAFERYGTLQETFLSRDPQKKYAIIKFETSSEAKLAMMKMNRTEPLKLSISVAYKNKKSDRRENHQIDGNYNEYCRDDIASVSSRGRSVRKEINSNGSNIGEDNLQLDEMILTDGMDSNGLMDSSLDLKLESLKLEQLKLREEQLLCKHRILMIQQSELAEKRQMPQSTSANRCILPNGRIVVRNVTDRLLDRRDGDVTHMASASDSLKIPGLQRVPSRACVQCEEPADAFCSRCGVTPYCSQRCQRRDWNERHKAVCHNLARLAVSGDTVKDEEDIPMPSSSVVSLRQPHAPAGGHSKGDDVDQDRASKNLMPDERKVPFTSAPGYRPNVRDSKPNHPPARSQETRRPSKQTPRDRQEPEEDWGDTSKKTSPKHEQLLEEPSPKIQVKGNKATPQAVSVTSSQSVRTDVTFKQSPAKPELQQQLHQAVKQQTTPTLQKEPRTNAVEMPGIESVKATTPTTNGVTAGADASTQVLIPKTYLLEELDVGEVIMLSVDGEWSECRSRRPGLVCLSMHENFEVDFARLCGDYALYCQTEEDYRPKPGDVFSLLNTDDGGWYRARCLTPKLAALIDSCKVVTVTPDDRCKKLPTKYADIPEFCCLLDANGVKVGANLKCTLVSKTANGFKVTLQDVEAGVEVGDGLVTRWLPEVDYPAPTGTSGIPEVCRPCVVHNARVLLVDATAPDRVVVRPSDVESQRAFDAILQDVLLYGIEASPITEPLTKGQTVIGKYTDGLHYRALCKRTNVKQNKYLLEYLEYGNIEVSKLEMLYPCPEHLDVGKVPTLASVVTLGLEVTGLTPSAEQYLEALKDEEMILSIPNGVKSAPSGSVVTLTLVKNNEVVNRKVEELCTPEWKKMEERGGDVTEVEKLMYGEMEVSELPYAGCNLEILDDLLLAKGSVSGCEAGLHYANYVFTKLTQRMGEYCNSALGRDPYLPRPEELCIAQYPPTGQWYRAALLEQVGGPGGDKAHVVYIDYGYLKVVPVALLRKMLPEFVTGLPAVACHLDIRDFPENPTADMLDRARRYMKMTASGRGELRVTRCERQDGNGLYTIDAPDLIKAMYAE